MAPIEALKNTKITLKTEQYIDNSIPLTKVFDDVKLSANAGNATVVDFQVPPFLKIINVCIETEVYNTTLQKSEKLKQEKSFYIRNMINGDKFCELFL